jgi:hypothetical protein
MNQGFTVDAAALAQYAKQTGTMSDDLEKVAKAKLGSVQDLAEDIFGKVGKETGFARALNKFADALEHQVKSVAGNANRFSRAVDRVATAYAESEADAVANLQGKP